MTNDPATALAEFTDVTQRLRSEMAKTIVGCDDVVTQLLVCMLTGGHALLEGVPGVGKTSFVRALAEACDLVFRRIQFTPDLMPADITGTEIFEETPDGRRFRFREGPLFGNLVLADEINRATPKTQSALLEAMQESSVTAFGTVHELPDPFLVFATQNPIEMAGTYPLPEAQLDRFLFKIRIPAPGADDLASILDRTTGTRDDRPAAVAGAGEIRRLRDCVRSVITPAPVLDFAVRLLLATRPTSNGGATPPLESVRRYVRYGASPRGGQALLLGGKVHALLDGRLNLAYDDIRAVAKPALAHRVLLDFEAEADDVAPEAIVEEILASVPETSDRVTKVAAAWPENERGRSEP